MPVAHASEPTEVHAVIAVFNPDDTVVDKVRLAARQVVKVVVVDDGSRPSAETQLQRIEHELGSAVTVLRLGHNSGIARALNVGIESAISAGASTVITLDQDSTISHDYVRSAAAAADLVSASGRHLFTIAAGTQSGHSVRPVSYEDRGDAVTPTLEAIQSGLVLTKTVFERVGPFDEGLFIDCVDTDFTLRAATLGVPTYLARACSIDHPLGRLIETPNMRTTRSGRRAFAYHPAWRRYYISRNRSVVFARYGAARPRWALLGVAGETVQLLRCVAFGPDKVLQIAGVALGVFDAMRGRRGRLSGHRAVWLKAPR